MTIKGNTLDEPLTPWETIAVRFTWAELYLRAATLYFNSAAHYWQEIIDTAESITRRYS